MLRLFLIVLTLWSVLSPAWCAQVDIRHPLVTEPEKGLYIDGKVYVPIDVVNKIAPGALVWDAEKQVITGTAVSALKTATAVLFIGDSASPALAALKAQGLAVEQKESLPDQLVGYAAVVAADAKACSTSQAKQLEEYVRSGGGLVLLGETPNSVLGRNKASASDWLGLTKVRAWGKQGISAFCSLSKPFGTTVKKGERIYAEKNALAKVGFVSLAELAKNAEPILQIAYNGADEPASLALYGSGPRREPIEVKAAKGCVAYSFNCDKGRVYWQSVLEAPKCPKLQDLFLGGVRWAGGFTETK